MMVRAETWLRALVSTEEFQQRRRRHGVLCCDAELQGMQVRYIAVIPDASDPFPRARHGEVGLLQGWALAAAVREAMAAEAARTPRGIVALVDVPSQAYGRTEEALGIPLALAAAVDAYASARLSGHASVTLILGKAFSGALLAHGYQASRVLALDSPSVQIQAMGKEAAMRVTRRNEHEFAAAAADVPPMAYDLPGFCKLEILHATIPCSDADNPTDEDVTSVRIGVAEALDLARCDGPYLAPRLQQQGPHSYRNASREVRVKMQEMWSQHPEENRS